MEKDPERRRTTLHGEGGFQLEEVLVHHVGNGVDMQRNVGERNGIRHRPRLDAVEDLLAERLVHGAEHEVVGLGDAHLLGCLAEVRLVAWDRAVKPELPEHPIRPHIRRCLGLDQLRRPPSPEHRATAEAIGEPGEADGHVRPPREPPHLGPGHAGVGRRRAEEGTRPRAGQVLDVLGEDVGPGVEDQNAVVAEAVAGQRLQGEYRAEGATSDDDDVERPTIDSGRAGDRLVQPVADVAAEHVLGEVRVLGGGARHAPPPALAVVDSSIFTPRIDRSPRCARSMTSGTVTAGR